MLNIATNHCPLTCYVIPTESPICQISVVIVAEEIAWNDFFKSIGLGIVDMIVNDVHDNTDVGLMISSDCFLQFNDSCIRIMWIRCKTTVRKIVLHRVVAPVIHEFWMVFINTAKIIHWHELDMSNAQLFDIIHSQSVFLQIRRLC